MTAQETVSFLAVLTHYYNNSRGVGHTELLTTIGTEDSLYRYHGKEEFLLIVASHTRDHFRQLAQKKDLHCKLITSLEFIDQGRNMVRNAHQVQKIMRPSPMPFNFTGSNFEQVPIGVRTCSSLLPVVLDNCLMSELLSYAHNGVNNFKDMHNKHKVATERSKFLEGEIEKYKEKLRTIDISEGTTLTKRDKLRYLVSEAPEDNEG
jgi:hypothetical protein